MQKRVIVTGGCGFIGGYVVRELINKNYAVTVIDNLTIGRKESLPQEVTFIHADVCDYEKIAEIINKDDIIFHLAALTSVPLSIETPLPYHTTNIVGTYNVLEAARKKGASGVIFSSSAAVYGSQEGEQAENLKTHPESPYALQKLIGEELCASYASLYNMSCICLRYFNVYGKGNHEEGSYAPVTARFLKAKREGKPLPIIGDGEQTRDFIHVKDVAKANVAAVSLLSLHHFDIINVCSGVSSKIIDIANVVGGSLTYLPKRIEVKHSLGNPSKLHTLIPQDEMISFETGLQDLMETESEHNYSNPTNSFRS